MLLLQLPGALYSDGPGASINGLLIHSCLEILNSFWTRDSGFHFAFDLTNSWSWLLTSYFSEFQKGQPRSSVWSSESQQSWNWKLGIHPDLSDSQPGQVCPLVDFSSLWRQWQLSQLGKMLLASTQSRMFSLPNERDSPTTKNLGAPNWGWKTLCNSLFVSLTGGTAPGRLLGGGSPVTKLGPTLQPHGLQHARLPCPSPSPEFAQTHVLWASEAIQPSHPLLLPSPSALNLS